MGQKQVVAVVGLARSGIAAAHFLKRQDYDVLAWDDHAAQREEALKAGVHVTPPSQWPWHDIEAMVLSPGIPHSLPSPHPLALSASEHHIPIICDIELLMKKAKKSDFIGITGTNGKSTTTALIGHLLKSAGHQAHVGGNIGVSPLIQYCLTDHQPTHVLELSSFQLERIPSLTLDIAVLLNISPDHLDRHGGIKEYQEVKKRIFDALSLKWAIIGVDDPCTTEVFNHLKSVKEFKVVPISCRQETPKGVYVLNGILYDDVWGAHQEIAEVKHFPALFGDHNAQNLAAAYAAGRAYGLSTEEVVRGLKSFPGLEHRLERVGEIGGVRFINDSKATNVDAAAKALKCYENIFWIVGGKGKGESLEPLMEYKHHIKKAFLMGESELLLKEYFQDRIPFQCCGTLSVAVEEALKSALKDPIHSVILLSPASASYDQFANFEERGAVFKDLFFALKQKMMNTNTMVAK